MTSTGIKNPRYIKSFQPLYSEEKKFGGKGVGSAEAGAVGVAGAMVHRDLPKAVCLTG